MDDHHRRECRQDDRQIPRCQCRAPGWQPQRLHEPLATYDHQTEHGGRQERRHEQGLCGCPSGTRQVTRPHAPRHECRGRDGRNSEETGQEAEAVGDEAHRSQGLGTLQEVACEPLVGKAHRQPQHLLQKDWQHEHRPAHLQHGPHRSRRVEDTARMPARMPPRRAAQVNNSLITLPELAIFIGRPFLAVNVVSREMPSDLSTLAITSCDE